MNSNIPAALQVILKDNPEVTFVCVHRSRTNLRAEFIVLAPYLGAIQDITRMVGVLLNTAGKRGVVVKGCGFNRSQHILNNLSMAVFNDVNYLTKWNTIN